MRDLSTAFQEALNKGRCWLMETSQKIISRDVGKTCEAGRAQQKKHVVDNTWNLCKGFKTFLVVSKSFSENNMW